MKKIFTILGIVALGTVANAQVNLVTNPGFETWTDTTKAPDTWLYSSGMVGAQSTTTIHSGASAASITSASGTSTLGASDIVVTEGKTYIYSAWYLDNTPNGRVRYWGQWRTASALLSDATLQQTDYSTDAPEWKQFSVEAIAPATATIARLSLRAYKDADNSTGGIVYFDDVMFYDKSTMGTIDVHAFDKNVKMNTLVSDVLTLQLPSRSTVNIYSVDGKLVSSNRVDNGGSINVSSLAKGNYIVTVQDNFNNKVSRKIIKK